MVSFRCICGDRMSESHTDFMTTRAHLIPDQDWEEVCFGTEAERLEITRGCRSMWQCPRCGALHVHDGRVNRAFAPVDPDGTPRHMLTSVHGDAWRGPMVGHWRPWITDGPKGELWWSDGDPTKSGFEHFDDPDELTQRYHEVFQERHAQGKLRSSFLRIDRTVVHQWSPTATEPE